MRMKLPSWRKAAKWLGIGAVIAALLVFLVLELFSRGAALIFNRAMEQQDLLRGTITVEKIYADALGHVFFENLEWDDPDGDQILFVPSGDFEVRLWDVVSGHMKSTTLQELNLNDAKVSMHFTDDMKVDFIRQSPDMKNLDKDPEDEWERTVSLVGKSEEELKAIGERKRLHREKKMMKRWSNFNRKGQRIKCRLNFNRCQVEMLYKERHYIMRGVQLHADINTERSIILQATTGGFGGDMIGNSINIDGTVDLHDAMPQCDLRLSLYDVDPSSLGFGVNIHDKMTLTSHFTGALANPVGEGYIKMPKLDIPALSFTNVVGNIHCEDSQITFSDVHANVYDGTLVAEGVYNIDTRYYHLQGHGENLSTRIALPDSHLSCRVNMDIEFDSKGNHRTNTVRGTFESGPGRFHLMPFQKLSGSFSDAYKDLRFYDVLIEANGFSVSTDAFSIIKGKLTLNPVQLRDAEGRLLGTFDLQAEKARMDQTRNNVEAVKH